MSKTVLYTDAGCKVDRCKGSYAYYVDESLKGSGAMEGFVSPTSCELLAVVIGLKRLAKLEIKDVLVKTDSQYVAGVVRDKAHWLSLKNNEKSHVRLVMRLYKVMEFFDDVKVVWIPEDSEEGNEIAHRIASARLREVSECSQISC